MIGVRLLLELQEIDAEIDARRRRFAQIQAQLHDPEQLAAARRELEAGEARLRALEGDQKSLEWDIDSAGSRAASLKSKMYGGQVSNPKELTIMTTEVAHLKVRQEELEDKLLGVMEQVDGARQEVEQQRRAAQEMEGQWLATQGHLLEEKARIESELPLWQAKRDRHGASLPETSKRLYEELRAAKGGIAVAKAVRGVCSGCRITLPITLVQRARADKELTYCSSCGRLLHAA